ncbi:MAG: DUF4920 domain-containing protein [Labilithrix sp.]
MRAVLFFTTVLFSSALTACVASPPAGTQSEPPPASAASDRGDAPTPGGRQGASGGKGSVNQATAAGIQALEKTKFGAPITETSTTPLPAIVKDPGQFASKTIRTEGMVSAVCQAAGCWMQIADTSGKAHVKMAGHAFFVPKASSGHRAVVQGKVLASNAPNTCSDSDHCGNQEVTQVQIEATGVEFVD